MLTAAVRDLHRCYPGRFLTDIRTLCSDIWDNNPYITALSDADPEAEHLDCAYPLIHLCNSTPYHCLHGFIEFLNEKLDLRIRPTEFRGDLHLSTTEKAWHSQVYELIGRDIPFWILVAGGKYDVTVKWWDHKRFQSVVNHFLGRVQFVQVGSLKHYHPKLSGVVDFRGKTSLRELIRLIYHSQGIVCPITAAMHLAAAVPTKLGYPPHRPCVVIAGGREPVHWEAYPHHQYIHRIGALPCSQNGGCWKDRVFILGDGDMRDRKENRCLNISNKLPRCMDMIKVSHVTDAIESYYEGGALNYLSPLDCNVAKKAVNISGGNRFDDQALTMASAGLECEKFCLSLTRNNAQYSGRGIVICAGGVEYFTNAWVCIRMLRFLGNTWPIELWHLGEHELNDQMESLVRPFKVKCVDATKLRKSNPVRRLWGWPLKAYSILQSSLNEVFFIDADNVPVKDPSYLQNSSEYVKTGAVFWPDRGQWDKSNVIWKSCRLRRPKHPEFESGQMLINKSKCWKALRLALWFNENYDFYYQYLHGDKETFHLAFRKVKKSFSMVPYPMVELAGTFCQHDFQGERIFQHRNTLKWKLHSPNPRVKGFIHENLCRRFIRELRQNWSGEIPEAEKVKSK